jgi:hypothetical protein
MLVAFIGLSVGQYPAYNYPHAWQTNTGTADAPIWVTNNWHNPYSAYPFAILQRNDTFDFEESVQGNGYFMTYMYTKAGNLAFKNYAHGSGQIDNEMTLQAYHKNSSIHQYGGYDTTYGAWTDEDSACIQFKEDNSMVYAPMKIAVGTGYYSYNPVSYDSLLKEKTWIKNYRAGTSMHHEVEYAHALDKELEVVAKEYRNYSYDPYFEGLGITEMKILEDVTDGKTHIGVLQANENFVGLLGLRNLLVNDITASGLSLSNSGQPGHQGAWYNPAVEIDEDYWGTYHIEKNMTLTVPYKAIFLTENWLPCCFEGWATMPPIYQRKFGRDTKGVFDCKCILGYAYGTDVPLIPAFEQFHNVPGSYPAVAAPI